MHAIGTRFWEVVITSTDVTAIPHPRTGQIRSRRLAAVGLATLAALLVWIAAVPLAGVDLQGPAGFMSPSLRPVELPAVIIMSLLAGLAGWGLLAFLERVTSRARRTWLTVAAIVWFVSLGGPLLGENVPTSSRITLALMHTVVAAVLVPPLVRTARS